MEDDLGQQLLQYPIKKQNNHQFKSPQTKRISPSFQSNQKLQRIKLSVLVTIATLFFLYRLFCNLGQISCIADIMHQWTAPINRLLNQNNNFYQTIVIIAQQSIQLNIILMCFISSIKVKNLKAHFFMGVFYGFRAILLNIEKFPYPPGIRWDAPFIPSLTVPYGITRDYFYSGHTGLMLFSTFWWKQLGYKWIYIISLILTPFVILVLLSTRVHYSIDIVAAIIFTIWLQTHLLKHVIIFDKFFSLFLNTIQKILDKARNWL